MTLNLPFRILFLGAVVAANYFLLENQALGTSQLNFMLSSTYQAFFLGALVWGTVGTGLQLDALQAWRGYLIAGGLLAHIAMTSMWFGYGSPWADQVLQILSLASQLALVFIFCALLVQWPAWTAWPASLLVIATAYLIYFQVHPFSSVAWISLRANPTRFLMFLTFFSLQFHYLKLRPKNLSQKFECIFNPAQSLFPLPLPSDGLGKRADARTYAQALINLGFATFALLLFLSVNRLDLSLSGWIKPVVGYLRYFIYQYYLIAFSVGLMQWCGYVLPQPCDLALLSATPHMRWRRWNRYTYKWLSLTVFFPILHKTNSRLLALGLSFLLVALMHLNAALFIPGATVTQEALPEYLAKHFTYYLGHAAAIWAGFLFPSSWADERRSSAWAGVVLTWILATCIFSVYY